MKKGIVLVLVLLLSFSLFAAGQQEAGASEGTGLAVSAPGVFPIVEETYELDIFTPMDVNVSDYDDNALTQYMEDLTNVHVNWQFVPVKELKQKMNLILASNVDMPDVFLGANQKSAMTNSTMARYGAEGIFVPLNNFIDTHGVEFKAAMEANPMVVTMITAPDGNIYSLPKISDGINTKTSVKLWLNTTFLDAVGMDSPDTTEEFYQVLKAFKEQDPNGNGIADEIPLIGATNGWNQQPDGFIMNSFVFYNRNNPYAIENGSVVAPFITEEWKNGLRYMNKLIEEGLLDPTSFTQDRNQLKQLVEEETMKVGGVTSGGFHVFTNVNNDRKMNYAIVAPLEGPTEIKRAWYNPYWSISTGAFVITNACENPEVAYKWADHFYSLETTLRGRFGVPGVDYIDPELGDVGSLGQPAVIKPILRWGSVQNSHWQFRQPGFLPKVYAAGQAVDPNDPYPMQAILDQGSTDLYEPYADASVFLPPLQFTTDEAEIVADIGSTIMTYVRESLARFAVGELDIDKDWDKYIAEFKVMDLDQLLDIYQTVYERQWK